MLTFKIQNLQHISFPSFKLILICFIFLLRTHPISSQEIKKDTTAKNTFRILPLIFYSPDTRWAFGAGGFYSLFLDRKTNTTKPSSIVFTLAYTQNRQILFLVPYSLIFPSKKIWLNGEIGYFRYIYNFFGIGNNIDEDYIEKYTTVFPRARLNALYNIKKDQFLGIRYAFDQYRFAKIDSSKMLFRDKIYGFENGTVSGFGISYIFDTRDYINYPKKGILAEMDMTYDHPLFGSKYKFFRCSVDITHFYPITEKQNFVTNFYTVIGNGKTPFHTMALVGGSKKLRGYYDGRFRDNSLGILQAEYRYHLWGPIKIHLFGGIGRIFHRIHELNFNYIRYNYGLGLRYELDKYSKLHLRLDYGIGKKSQGFYLTVGEAF